VKKPKRPKLKTNIPKVWLGIGLNVTSKQVGCYPGENYATAIKGALQAKTRSFFNHTEAFAVKDGMGDEIAVWLHKHGVTELNDIRGIIRLIGKWCLQNMNTKFEDPPQNAQAPEPEVSGAEN